MPSAICRWGYLREKVRGLLGEPEPVPGPGGAVDGFGNQLIYPVTWSYWLGSWSSLSWYGFDSAFLYVHFGSDGKVAKAEITGGESPSGTGM